MGLTVRPPHGLPAFNLSQEIVTKLKAQLFELKKQFRDDDQFANNLPKDGVDGPPPAWAPGFQPLAGDRDQVEGAALRTKETVQGRRSIRQQSAEGWG